MSRYYLKILNALVFICAMSACPNVAEVLSDEDKHEGTRETEMVDEDEELEDIAETTRRKLRQVLFKMLNEAKFLNKDNTILLVILSPRSVNLICRNSSEDLLIYPITERNLVEYLYE